MAETVLGEVRPRSLRLSERSGKSIQRYFGQSQMTLRTVLLSLLFCRTMMFEFDKVSTCSYVANSGTMLGSKLGEEIDSRDLVFRINYGKTNAFGDDVGRRSDVRIFGAWRDVTGLRGTRQFGLLKGKRLELDFNVTDESIIVLRGNRVPSQFTFRSRTNKELKVLRLSETPKNKLPAHICRMCPTAGWWSTGFWGVFSLSLFCQHVWAYGFKTSPRSPHHYYENMNVTEHVYHQRVEHPMKLEKKIFRKIAKQYTEVGQTSVHELDVGLIHHHGLDVIEEWQM